MSAAVARLWQFQVQLLRFCGIAISRAQEAAENTSPINFTDHFHYVFK
jgi:hypothetical protein